MKRPTKKPKLVDTYWSYLESGVKYTPERLSQIADAMRADGTVSIELEVEDYCLSCICSRMETEAEAETRYKNELVRYKALKISEKDRKELRKIKLIKEAKSLGLNVSDPKA